MRRTLFICGIAWLFYCGCANKRTYVHSSLESKNVAAETLVLLSTEPQIIYPDDIKSELQYELSADLYAQALRSGLPHSLQSQSRFKQVMFQPIKHNFDVQPQVFSLNDDRIVSIHLPTRSVAVDSLRPEWLLVLENVAVTVQRDRVEDSDPRKRYKIAGGTAERNATVQNVFHYKYNIVQTSYFAFFDNHTANVAAYGIVETETPMSNESMNLVLKRCMDDFASAILKDTPFK